MRFLLLSMIFATSIAACPSGFAQNAGGKDKHEIHVNIDPKLTQLDRQYKEAIKNLSPAQIEILKNLEKENVSASDSHFELISVASKFRGCAKIDPSFERDLLDNMINFKLTKEDETEQSWLRFGREQRKADFIDPALLDAHLRMTRSISTQMLSGMSKVLEQAIAEGKSDRSECEKVKATLAQFEKPYFVETNGPPPTVQISRDAITGKTNVCSLGFRHTTPTGDVISIGIILADMQTEGLIFDFSSKVFTASNKNLSIESLWLEIGSYSTRFKARTTKPGLEMMIGKLPVDDLPQALFYMKHAPVIVGLKAAPWDRQVSFRAQPVSPSELNKFASCAASIKKDFAGPLQKAGFTVTPDQSSASPMAARTEKLLYKTQYMDGDADNPGGCIWLMGPARDGEKEVFGALITGGKTANDNPYNNQAVFWVIGGNKKGESVERVNFTESRYTVQTSGKALDSDAFATRKKTGQRYEILMPFEAASPFLDAIGQNGVTITAHAQEWKTPLKATLPPPEQVSVDSYRACLSKL